MVIRTDRGVELGYVLGTVCQGEHRCRAVCLKPDHLRQFIRDNGTDYPYSRDGRILRLATPQDVSDQDHLDRSCREELQFCRQQSVELRLPMKLVAVENLLGGERIIFFFTSESRVDFRELVRRLAGQYRTRIEMRQVGARDEARLVADYERCGQRCCCQQFLKSLQPVSMRMAKMQKATLDPAKISGRCGRLMCCLRYEDVTYEELKDRLPRRNVWVRTAEAVGKVIETQILTQLVRLVLPDGLIVVVPNEAILETNVPAPPMREPAIRPSLCPRTRPSASGWPTRSRRAPPRLPTKPPRPKSPPTSRPSCRLGPTPSRRGRNRRPSQPTATAARPARAAPPAKAGSAAAAAGAINPVSPADRPRPPPASRGEPARNQGQPQQPPPRPDRPPGQQNPPGEGRKRRRRRRRPPGQASGPPPPQP